MVDDTLKSTMLEHWTQLPVTVQRDLIDRVTLTHRELVNLAALELGLQYELEPEGPLETEDLESFVHSAIDYRLEEMYPRGDLEETEE